MIIININPIAFTIGSMAVRWYGILMALGVMVLIGWTLLQVRRGARLTPDDVLGAALVGIPSGIVFARLLHVIDGQANINYYFSDPVRIIGGEGLTIYGAILGAALGIWVYSRFTRLNFAYTADIVTPGIILAQAIGRVGCLINGCCYGDYPTSLPWGVVYTQSACFAPLGVPVHPTQAYEILFPGTLWRHHGLPLSF